MSVNPVAVTGAAAEALIAAELKLLAADAASLRRELQPGQIVSARILPFNGLTDLIEIDGKRVAAQLPPTFRPGDQVQAQVTGFDGPRILIQILGPEGAPEAVVADGSEAAPQAGTAAAAASPDPAAALVEALASETPAGGDPPAPVHPLAPPVAVFVAASIRPQPAVVAVAAPPPEPGTEAAPPAAGDAAGAAEPAPAVPAGPPPAPGTPRGTWPASGVPLDGAGPTPIEARLAAARAGAAPALRPAAPAPPAAPESLPAATPRPAAGAPPAGAAPVRPLLAPAIPPFIPGRLAPAAAAPLPGAPPGPAPAPAPAPAPPPRGFVLPPPITVAAEGGRQRGAAGAVAPGPEPAQPAPAAPAPARLAAFRDPAALVRALHLAPTATNLGAARLALESPQRVAAALATLENALPKGGDDPMVETLRTLTSFVAKLEPQSPHLAAQISAYVDQVVDGREGKLVDFLTARAAADAPAEPAAANAPGSASAGGTNAPAPPPGAPAPPAGTPAAPQLPVVPLALAAEREGALAHDLKTAILAVIAAHTAAGGGDAGRAATAALTAVTGAQLAVAQNLADAPQQVTFALPMWLGGEYADARIAVDRDRPDMPRVALDGDNFHVGFVLNTKHMGTVVVDLKTVGRSVNVTVKTEASPAAERFSAALERLTGRLEHLRYRVAAAEATVVERAPEAVPAAEPEPVSELAVRAAPGEFSTRA